MRDAGADSDSDPECVGTSVLDRVSPTSESGELADTRMSSTDSVANRVADNGKGRITERAGTQPPSWGSCVRKGTLHASPISLCQKDSMLPRTIG